MVLPAIMRKTCARRWRKSDRRRRRHHPDRRLRKTHDRRCPRVGFTYAHDRNRGYGEPEDLLPAALARVPTSRMLHPIINIRRGFHREAGMIASHYDAVFASRILSAARSRAACALQKCREPAAEAFQNR